MSGNEVKGLAGQNLLGLVIQCGKFVLLYVHQEVSRVFQQRSDVSEFLKRSS